jgi:hypothetical protein
MEKTAMEEYIDALKEQWRLKLLKEQRSRDSLGIR